MNLCRGYVGNNPMSYSDPFGLQSQDWLYNSDYERRHKENERILLNRGDYVPPLGGRSCAAAPSRDDANACLILKAGTWETWPRDEAAQTWERKSSDGSWRDRF